MLQSLLSSRYRTMWTSDLGKYDQDRLFMRVLRLSCLRSKTLWLIPVHLCSGGILISVGELPVPEKSTFNIVVYTRSISQRNRNGIYTVPITRAFSGLNWFLYIGITDWILAHLSYNLCKHILIWCKKPLHVYAVAQCGKWCRCWYHSDSAITVQRSDIGLCHHTWRHSHILNSPNINGCWQKYSNPQIQ